jgi:protein TonB
VDRDGRLVRNSQVPAHAHKLPLESATRSPGSPAAEALMVDVVVLSGDVALFEAIRHAVGERNPVWRARSAEESVDLLLTGRCGVLLIDLSAVSAKPATLVEQIVDQFPDVVVVVAGSRDDEPVLAHAISDGLVYRFMHKPLSPKRAGMFLNAAIRSHVERREGRATDPLLLPLVRELRTRVDPRKWLFVGTGLVLFMALLAGLLLARHARLQEAAPAAATAERRPAAAAPATSPRADPVLSRARAAFAAGRYEAPPGRNALDLYAAALLARPDDAEARRGLEATVARLLQDAEHAADAGDAAEARRLAERVLQVDADRAVARRMLARLDSPPLPSAPVARSLPPVTAPPRSAEPLPKPAAIAATPVLPAPVSRLPARTPAPTPARTPAVVRPDPLTPLVIGSGTLPTSPTRRSSTARSRVLGGPASSGHPTAGYVQRATATTAVAASQAPPVEAPLPDRDLEAVSMPEPLYPPGAFRAGVEGWVEVDFTVTAEGTTRDVEVAAAHPGEVFDDAAVAAVANWTFRPRVVNGRPVPQRSSVTLRFSVEN